MNFYARGIEKEINIIVGNFGTDGHRYTISTTLTTRKSKSCYLSVNIEASVRVIVDVWIFKQTSSTSFHPKITESTKINNGTEIDHIC